MDATYISSNKFSVLGNKTNEFVPGRRLKSKCGTNTYYSTVYSSVVSGTYTVITTEESNLTSDLSSVLYGILEPGISGSVPKHSHDNYSGSGGIINTIEDDITLYISVSGSDSTGDGSSESPWQSFSPAWNYLDGKKIKSGKLVTIKFKDGTHTISGTLDYLNHPYGSQILISGETVLDRNITSVQSSSGSSGNYSIIFNVDTASGVEIGDYMLVSYDAANGTNPSYACGCHEITDVDLANDRITIKSTHQKGAPSGSVTASISIFKTILSQSSADDFLANYYGAVITLGDFAIVGTAGNALVVKGSGSNIICSSPIGISGFQRSVYVLDSGFVSFENCGCSNSSGEGVLVRNLGNIDMNYAVVTGGNNHGIMAYYAAFIQADYSVSTGNTYNGYLSGYGSTILAQNSTSTGNGNYGWRAYYNSTIRRTGTCVGGNNTSGDTNTSDYGIVKT